MIGIAQQFLQALGIIGEGGDTATYHYPDGEIAKREKTRLFDGQADLFGNPVFFSAVVFGQNQHEFIPPP